MRGIDSPSPTQPCQCPSLPTRSPGRAGGTISPMDLLPPCWVRRPPFLQTPRLPARGCRHWRSAKNSLGGRGTGLWGSRAQGAAPQAPRHHSRHLAPLQPPRSRPTAPALPQTPGSGPRTTLSSPSLSQHHPHAPAPHALDSRVFLNPFLSTPRHPLSQTPGS